MVQAEAARQAEAATNSQNVFQNGRLSQNGFTENFAKLHRPLKAGHSKGLPDRVAVFEDPFLVVTFKHLVCV